MADTPDQCSLAGAKEQTDRLPLPGPLPGFFMATCGIDLTERQMRPHAAGGFLLFGGVIPLWNSLPGPAPRGPGFFIPFLPV